MLQHLQSNNTPSNNSKIKEINLTTCFLSRKLSKRLRLQLTSKREWSIHLANHLNNSNPVILVCQHHSQHPKASKKHLSRWFWLVVQDKQVVQELFQVVSVHQATATTRFIYFSRVVVLFAVAGVLEASSKK